jgi:hypothetical protein
MHEMRLRDLASKRPDEYAWRLFAAINARAGAPRSNCENVDAPEQDDGSRDACWERWADATSNVKGKGDVYAKYDEPEIVWPHHDARDHPVFSAMFQDIYAAVVTHNGSQAQTSTEIDHDYRETFDDIKKLDAGEKLPEEEGWLQPALDKAHVLAHVEEIRMNKATFDYVALKHLWYKEGEMEVANCGKPINFPQDSIVVKAAWERLGCNIGRDPAKCADKTKGYHWQVDQSGNVYRLIGLHVISKTLPSWVWATWEHKDSWDPTQKDNERYPPCNVVACHDSFGYPDGPLHEPSDGLKNLMRGLAPEWRNYRLHGTQVSAVDATGRPTFMGNSILEALELDKSSCITCHSKVVVNLSWSFPGVPAGEAGLPGSKWFAGTDVPVFLWSIMSKSACRDGGFGCNFADDKYPLSAWECSKLVE